MGYHSSTSRPDKRHPSGNISKFTTSLENILQSQTFNSIRSDCFLLADQNIDMLKFESQNQVQNYINMLIGYDFLPLSTLPTRITCSSATLIDHMLVRFNNKTLCSCNDATFKGCITTDISDHLANFLVLPLKTPKQNNCDRPLIRIFSESNKLLFLTKLRDVDWISITNNANDVNATYTNFSCCISRVYDSCFPLLRVS